MAFLDELRNDEPDARESALDLIDEEIITSRQLSIMLLKYMSLDDIQGCLNANELELGNALYSASHD